MTREQAMTSANAREPKKAREVFFGDFGDFGDFFFLGATFWATFWVTFWRLLATLATLVVWRFGDFRIFFTLSLSPEGRIDKLVQSVK